MAKNRRFRWKLWVIVAFLAIILIVGVVFWPKPQEDPLAGFTIMNLPRRDLDIGALWTQGIGPVRGSSAIPKLQTKSLQTSQVSRVGKVHASIFANIARSLHLSASGSNQASRPAHNGTHKLQHVA